MYEEERERERERESLCGNLRDCRVACISSFVMNVLSMMVSSCVACIVIVFGGVA